MYYIETYFTIQNTHQMKKSSVLMLLLLIGMTAKAQFSHQGGASIFFATPKGDEATSAYGLTYYPRFSFSNISVGAPISIGVSGSSNSRSGVSDASLTYMLPLAVDYNFGMGSQEEEDADGGLGGYLGAGYGLFSTSYVGALYSSSISTSGPLARAGIRFMISERIFDIGATYMQGISSSKASVIGISVLYKF